MHSHFKCLLFLTFAVFAVVSCKERKEKDGTPDVALVDGPTPSPDDIEPMPVFEDDPMVDYADLDYESDGSFSFEKKPFTGVAETKGKDGSVTKHYEFEDGVFHGITSEVNEDGTKTLTHWDMGKRHGENTYWNADGSVQKVQMYDHDVVVESTDPADQEEIENAKKAQLENPAL